MSNANQRQKGAHIFSLSIKFSRATVAKHSTSGQDREGKRDRQKNRQRAEASKMILKCYTVSCTKCTCCLNFFPFIELISQLLVRCNFHNVYILAKKLLAVYALVPITIHASARSFRLLACTHSPTLFYLTVSFCAESLACARAYILQPTNTLHVCAKTEIYFCHWKMGNRHTTTTSKVSGSTFLKKKKPTPLRDGRGESERENESKRVRVRVYTFFSIRFWVGCCFFAAATVASCIHLFTLDLRFKILRINF